MRELEDISPFQWKTYGVTIDLGPPLTLAERIKDGTADPRDYPRVKLYAGRARHFFGWEAGVMWGRRPFDQVLEGDLVYTRCLGIEVRAGLWRLLRSLLRIVRR